MGKKVFVDTVQIVLEKNIISDGAKKINFCLQFKITKYVRLQIYPHLDSGPIISVLRSSALALNCRLYMYSTVCNRNKFTFIG
jgi:hypothetical protein